MIDFLYIVLGLVILILGGNWLLKASVALSLKINIPKIVIGITVVSFATSAPELIVSIKSAMDGYPDLSLGNVVGSNTANLGLVLGITLLLGKIDITKSFYKTDWPVMMIATLLFMWFIYNDRVLVFWEGLSMFVILIVFIWYLVRFQKSAIIDEMPEDDQLLPFIKIFSFLGIGGVALWGGSELLVKGAVAMAYDFGVSERIIGITVVSVGTSIPELAASVIAVLKKEKAISLGNLVGSNIFNLLAVLGITSMIVPIQVVDQQLINSDVFWMLGVSVLIFPLVFFPKGMRLSWPDGLILLAVYFLFIYNTIQ